MRQIDNKTLVSSLSALEMNSDFNDFILNRKSHLLEFKMEGFFMYEETKKVISPKTGKEKSVKKSYKYKIKKDDCFDKYLNLLVNNLSDIIKCDQIGLLSWKTTFETIDFSGVSILIKKGFFNKLLKVLNYKELRSGKANLLFSFYELLGVKACVYCNSQHVILLKSSKKARLQADHNLPKVDYPCFSITLSNLYPSCNNCNHQKNEDLVDYFLYYSSKPDNEFKFELNPKEISKFLINKLKEEQLTIKFDQGTTKINSVLKIEEIYENHKDYVADLIRKYRIYNTSYMSKLTTSFNQVFGTDEKVLNRLVFGATLDKNDINKRIFSKLTIDIKSQLDELSKKPKKRT